MVDESTTVDQLIPPMTECEVAVHVAALFHWLRGLAFLAEPIRCELCGNPPWLYTPEGHEDRPRIGDYCQNVGFGCEGRYQRSRRDYRPQPARGRR